MRTLILSSALLAAVSIGGTQAAFAQATGRGAGHGRAGAERQSVESAGPHACQPAGSQQPYRPQSTGHANAAGTSEHHARGAPITDGACGAKNQRE
jgi:hypothetical protein